MTDTVEVHLTIPHGTPLPDDPELVVDLSLQPPEPPFRRSYYWNLQPTDDRLEWHGSKAVSTWGVMQGIPYRVVIP